jgi:hypothetical protein
MAIDAALETKAFSQLQLLSVQMMVGTFDSISDADAQDAMLHSIFSSVVYHHHHTLGANSSERQRLNKSELRGVLMTLFRLFFKEAWSPARTYFHLLTGKLLVPMDDSQEEEREALEVMDSTLILNPVTIVGDCDRECVFMNNLWFDSESYYDNDNASSSISSSTHSSCSEQQSETRSNIEEYVAEMERRHLVTGEDYAARATRAAGEYTEGAIDASSIMSPTTARRRRRRNTPRLSTEVPKCE